MDIFPAIRISAIVGFLGVALGAFGAHALKEHLAALHMGDVWEKAVFYHLVHAVVLLLLAGRPVGASSSSGSSSLAAAFICWLIRASAGWARLRPSAG
jgi:uncharacterized membrane protein YgdD (TMEM256/DUF423 family)